jgi:hypothetical protein
MNAGRGELTVQTVAEAQPAWIQVQVVSRERPEHAPNKDEGSPPVLLQLQIVGLRPFVCRENKAHVLCKLRASRVQFHAPVDLVAGQLGQRERG